VSGGWFSPKGPLRLGLDGQSEPDPVARDGPPVEVGAPCQIQISSSVVWLRGTASRRCSPSAGDASSAVGRSGMSGPAGRRASGAGSSSPRGSFTGSCWCRRRGSGSRGDRQPVPYAEGVTPVLVGEPADLRLRGELRYGLELASLVRDPAFLRPGRQLDAPPVLLMPGLMAGDASLAVLRGWLGRRGSRTSSAGIRLNVDCSRERSAASRFVCAAWSKKPAGALS
jgi:hypothetical protein